MAPSTETGQPIGQTAEDMLEPIRAFVETATSMQSELLTLWNQRTVAYLDLPRQISACRSTSDLVEEQIKFLATMQQNYGDYAKATLRAAKPTLEQAERFAGEAGERRSQPQRRAA
jgi:hypothetical protein